jgi:chromosome partitioning protein
MSARIISVANQKGGVGKTTTTTNLGASLFRLGHRVLLADMDPQGNLSSTFSAHLTGRSTIADALLDRKVALPIVPVYVDQTARLDLVPTSMALATAEAALMNKLGREFRLRDQLATMADAYDFILIDTPPSLGLLTINSLVAAQLVLIPTEARLFSLQGLQMLQESIEEILYINPSLRILGIVLSKFDRRLRESKPWPPICERTGVIWCFKQVWEQIRRFWSRHRRCAADRGAGLAASRGDVPIACSGGAGPCLKEV